jgi:hypothetical protein
VVADDVDRQARLGLAVDVAEEVAEVHGPVAGGDSLPITFPVAVLSAASRSTVP